MRANTIWLFMLSLVGLAPVAASAAPTGDVAIVGARIYVSPDAPPIEDGVIVVRAGKIVAVGPHTKVHPPMGVPRIDGRGETVTAGFWNSHVHLMLPTQLEAAQKSKADLDQAFDGMLNRWGFTTIFDIASPLTNTEILRHRIETGEVRGPKILTVGDAFYPEGGTPIYVKDFMAEHHFPNWEVSTPEQAARRAADELDHGSDGVKIFAGAIVGGKVGVLPMRLDIATAVVAEAHKRGKPAFAHPSNQAGLDVAIDSGVDVLAHPTFEGPPWSPELVKRLRDHNMALTPTLTLLDVELQKEGGIPQNVHDALMAKTVGQVKTYHDAGGQILFGTDVGYIATFDTTEEYQLMGRAMDWRAILVSLTTAPAQRFGFAAAKGQIRPGMDADLTVLDADPAKDVTAFAKVKATIKGGKVIYERR